MYEYRCKIVKVVDGDTVDCEIDLGFHIYTVQRVRLLGIDTPELNSRDEAERELAKEAKQFVVDLADAVNRIKTVLDKTDKYGRILGTLYIDGNDHSINEMLLTEGLAKVY